jgi:hypothetical protein
VQILQGEAFRGVLEEPAVCAQEDKGQAQMIPNCCAQKDSLEFAKMCACGHAWAVHRYGHPHECIRNDDASLITGRTGQRCDNGCTAFVLLDSSMAELVRDVRREENSRSYYGMC